MRTSFMPRRAGWLALGVVGALVGGASALAVSSGVSSGGDEAAPAPLGSGTDALFAELSAGQTATAAIPPSQLGEVQGGEIRAGSGRLALASDGQRLLVFESSKGADRFCAVTDGGAAGSLWGVRCGPKAALDSGKLLFRQQVRLGGRGTPAVYFGLLPDGVSSVRAATAGPAQVSGGAFALYSADGAGTGALTYTMADGRTSTVDPTSPG